MGKYSSDSDNEKRGRSSYKGKSKRRSSSSNSSDSRNRKHKRKGRSRSRDKYSRSRRSHSGSSSRKSRTHRRSSSRTKHKSSRHGRDYIREYKSRRRSTSSSDSEPVKIEAPKSPQISGLEPAALAAINEEGFTQKSFTSSKNKKVLENIVIDLKKQTIKVPEVEPVEPDGVFHHNLFLNEEARMEKWVKELYAYRQKALQQGVKPGEK